MALCIKCGKEIPDGEELCEDCKEDDIEIDPRLLESMSEDMVSDGDADINELLDILSKDYLNDDDADDTSSDVLSNEESSEDAPSVDPIVQDNSPQEVSLFSKDESEEIFADKGKETSVEDIFQDALDAVGYSEKEEDESEDLDEFDGISFETPEEDVPEEEQEEETAAPVPKAVKKEKKKKEKKPKKVKDPKKPGVMKRVFGNIITDETAEEEAKEREMEQADAEKRAAMKEEQKKKAAEEKEAKAAAAKEAKEKKAAEKAEQAAAKAEAKAAAKEEKERRKAELAATEVVGKINPVGATIVMVFFGLLGIGAIVGTLTLSYKSSVRNAEAKFENREYQEAYESLAGVNVSESSAEMADKIRICMQLQKELDSYANYYELKMYLQALDSLMKGVRNYDANIEKANEYEIMSQYDELKEKITSNLNSEFGVSETQAREINELESQEEYTARLEDIIGRWNALNAEDEK